MTRTRATQRLINRSSGFSLIELMVTIVVAGIILSIAIPSFRNLILSNELTTTTNDWVSAVNTARSEAIKRGASAVVCGDEQKSDGLSSNCVELGQVWAYKSGTADATLVREGVEMPASVSTTGSQSIQFNALGTGRLGDADPFADPPYAGLIVDISSPDLNGANHRCIELVSGSAVVTNESTGACN